MFSKKAAKKFKAGVIGNVLWKKGFEQMKSMLQEAPSIIKAVEKAWIESGKPTEFTINILEKGEKNFLGLTKRYAVVSITFNSVKRVEKGKFREQNGGKPVPKKIKGISFLKGKYKQVKDEKIKTRFVAGEGLQKKVQQEKQIFQPEDLQGWVTEWVTFVGESLKEILNILKISTDFSIKINKNTLIFTFKAPVLEKEENNKAFFSGLGSLLMQFLKRKYKKKFRGYQILLNCLTPNDSSNQAKSN